MKFSEMTSNQSTGGTSSGGALFEDARVVRLAQSDAKSYRCEIGPVQTYIALVGVFSGLPPSSVQTSAEVDVTQPLPLHEF